jgi:cytochrome c peroxidase
MWLTETMKSLLLVVALVAGGQTEPPVPMDTPPSELPLDEIPYGLDLERPVPADNPLTPAKVQLGRRLFFDPILSVDRKVACASCHDPARGFAGAEPRAIGVGRRHGRRNAPSLLNRAYGTSFFWDGRSHSLEDQTLKPLLNASELGNPSHESVVERLQADPKYRVGFAAAFPDGVTAANLARAIASFERTILVGDSRVDRFHAGQVDLLNESERQGLWLFTSRGQCWRCHSGPNLSDEAFHNTGVSWAKEPIDLGRFEVTGMDADKGRFKTPTLRDIAKTGPYMHDGSIATLREVVEFYSRGGVHNPYLDSVMRPLNLTSQEVTYLVDFLRALSPIDAPADNASR